VAAAHVTGTVVVGAGVAHGWSCSSRRYDERVPLLLFLRMKSPRMGGCCLCCYCWGCGSREERGWHNSVGERGSCGGCLVVVPASYGGAGICCGV